MVEAAGTGGGTGTEAAVILEPPVPPIGTTSGAVPVPVPDFREIDLAYVGTYNDKDCRDMNDKERDDVRPDDLRTFDEWDDWVRNG